ncbi:MAG: protein kinase [Calditrichae bacterium]|nr:protein kinase [Calditrichia bacterium]
MIGKTILHYKIQEKLGEGGMGVVYKAQDLKLKRDVAIKFLPKHIAANTEERKRFEVEAQAAASFNHPNIATIYAIEEARLNDNENEVFIVMEFIDGVELKNKILESNIAIDSALNITRAIAEGLKAAHEKGIIHRDIKSSNIMITKDGKVKVMDFGLAKVKGSELVTRVGTTLGTAAYMSPEQAQGIKLDHRTDLWSLGVIFYEMLTSELPFKAEHEAAWSYVIVNEHPLEPSELDRKIPAHIDDIVLKLLEKDREKRFASADELINSISDAEKGISSADQQTKTKAIAVLPFNNISSEKETDYFSDGLAEELIMNLSRLKDMRVVSRTTTMQYKGTTKGIKTIGKELGVRYLIEGSVRKFQDKLRITAQLIDVATDTQLWAETYKGDLADVFDIQEQVSKQIVDALMLKLTPTEKVVLSKRSTVNPEAFDCYLRARNYLYQRTKNGIQFAIQLFKQAIQLDERYAAAYAGLGEAYATMHFDYDTKDVWFDKAIESSLKALMYDSSLSEAYAALGLAYMSKRSLNEAAEACQKAIGLDPNNFSSYWILGRVYHLLDRDREAIEMQKKVIELNPNFHTAYGDLRIVYERLNEKEKHDDILQKLLDVYPKYLAQHPEDARSHIYYAIDLATVGRNEEAKNEAEKALQLSPDDPLMYYNAACSYARMNETKLAINALKNSVAKGLEDYEWIKRDTDLENIRKEPEYLELMYGK